MPASVVASAESLPEGFNDQSICLRQFNDLIPEQQQQPSLTNTLSHFSFCSSHSPKRACQCDSQDGDVLRVSLRVDASPGCGGIIWPAGEVLSRYIARRPYIVAGKSVIELGSGTGLVGLLAAFLGASHVWITDQSPLLDIMRTNVGLNGLGDVVDVIEYIWGSSKPDVLPSRAGLILAADCVYFEPAFPLLVTTLCDLVSEPGSETEVLFCYKKRRKADKRFFNLLRKHFDWKQSNMVMRIVREALSEFTASAMTIDQGCLAFDSVDDDPDFPNYSREAISLLRLTRKRLHLGRII